MTALEVPQPEPQARPDTTSTGPREADRDLAPTAPPTTLGSENDTQRAMVREYTEAHTQESAEADARLEANLMTVDDGHQEDDSDGDNGNQELVSRVSKMDLTALQTARGLSEGYSGSFGKIGFEIKKYMFQAMLFMTGRGTDASWARRKVGDEPALTAEELTDLSELGIKFVDTTIEEDGVETTITSIQFSSVEDSYEAPDASLIKTVDNVFTKKADARYAMKRLEGKTLSQLRTQPESLVGTSVEKDRARVIQEVKDFVEALTQAGAQDADMVTEFISDPDELQKMSAILKGIRENRTKTEAATEPAATGQ